MTPAEAYADCVAIAAKVADMWDAAGVGDGEARAIRALITDILARAAALTPPAVTAWTPPPESERPDGYECQIMTDAMWTGGAWVTRNKFILDGGVYAFAPLPGDAP